MTERNATCRACAPRSRWPAGVAVAVLSGVLWAAPAPLLAQDQGAANAQERTRSEIVTQSKSYVLEGIITGGMFGLALLAVCFASQRV